VFDVLAYLIRNRERVVSKDDLIATTWDGRVVSDAAVTTRINVARAAIGDSGEAQRLIKTLPRKGFRFVAAVQEEQGPSDADATAASVEPRRPALVLPDKPSIAVLPFANLSGEAEQEYLADGIVEDTITELSRFSELFVIAAIPASSTKAGRPMCARSGAISGCAMSWRAVCGGLATPSASPPS
jgi:DNA-binding winged helix-turn-helix (wHTH) protein